MTTGYGRFAAHQTSVAVLMGGLLLAHSAFSQKLSAGVSEPTSTGNAVSGLVLKAEALRDERKNREAYDVIKQALKLDGGCGHCYSVFSGIAGNLQRYEEGEAAGVIGVTLSKTARDRATSAYNRGFNLGGLGRHKEALEAYEAAIEFDPTYALAHFGKGKTNYFFGKWEISRTSLKQALALNPSHGPSWAYLAEDELFLGHPQAGMLAANQAVKLAPLDARSFRARAIANFSIKDFQSMLEDATRTLELDPDRPQAHLLRGHALTGLRRDDEAASEYALEPGGVSPEVINAISPRPSGRMANCGSFITELPTPTNPDTGMFDECIKRVVANLERLGTEPSAKHSAKRKSPGVPTKKVPEK